MCAFGPIRSLQPSGGGRQGITSSGGAGSSGQPSASFGKTLQFITSIKLEELEKQRLAFDAHSVVIEKASALGHDLPRRVELLLEAVRSWRGSGATDQLTVIANKLGLSSLDLWLLQARKDPGFSPAVVQDWADTLEAHIRHSVTRFEFAKLFGRLFNEWLSSGDSVVAQDSANMPRTKTSDDFVEVGRKEMFEQQERLKSIIFEPKVIDTDGLTTYLSDLFSDESSGEVLHNMRQGMEQFGEDLQSRVITADDMQWTIKSLLATDLMHQEKQDALREFSQNSTVLDELATVMTMRLASIEAWTWPAHGAQVDMRRHLNGKYRAFTDPDVLDALFLQYIGIMWQVKFKQDCLDIFSSKAWKQAFPPLSRSEVKERQTYFGETSSTGIHSHRQTLRSDHFLVGQLASQTQVPASHVKQELLHAVATECYLNTTLHKTHTVVCTDLEWFGPSLAFDTILTCLAFFGVSQKWLGFFRAFLEVPLTFKDDKAGDAPRLRRCGTPISYALSALFGEVVLFGFDFAVNQRVSGLFLHRIHDDIWFWDSKSEKSLTSSQYAVLAGLTFNETKTGSACVGADVAPELPSGDIRWGFLKFDSTQSRFVIDQAEVDKHIVELRRQLSATKSVFGWINAYNKYMAFFSRNFGARPTVSFGPALCLGQAHVDDMIDTLARIQRELFPSSSGAVGHLRSVIGERFDVDDLPDGYFYFPIACGGMELRNPLIELLAVRDAFGSEPASQFAKQMAKDTEDYQRLQEKWNSATTRTLRDTIFPPFKQYIARRETGLPAWKNQYCDLMRTAKPKELRVPMSLTMEGRRMDFYDRWVLSLYGNQLVKKFGSLEVVDPNLIPVGLVHLFRGSRHQWDQ
ncbi:hypothetical protein B0H10DRAFT_1941169 [Mycena sp. CBHHK59/15]|nr:hypothetical protein B0H10DRAFT_1941169 [Mycena sp. CBHHK59/15]